MKPDLSVKLGPLELANPVMTASGTFGYGSEYEEFFDPSILGAPRNRCTATQRHASPKSPPA